MPMDPFVFTAVVSGMFIVFMLVLAYGLFVAG
jgi:hypothetical protein